MVLSPCPPRPERVLSSVPRPSRHDAEQGLTSDGATLEEERRTIPDALMDPPTGLLGDLRREQPPQG